MCTETFRRLPEEKKNRFLDAAWEEFTRTSFEKASINKIVANARVPRGSFYQYFADKEDLFFYLLGNMMKYLMAEYNKMLIAEQGDIFRTQVQCFDRVMIRKETDPVFARGMEILQQNPRFMAQAIVEGQVCHHLWDSVREYVDLAALRNRNELLARETFVLSLIALVQGMTDAISHPEQTEECRQALLLRLDILKCGSLEQTGRTEGSRRVP